MTEKIAQEIRHRLETEINDLFHLASGEESIKMRENVKESLDYFVFCIINVIDRAVTKPKTNKL
jgi:hypothetical protein